MNVATDIRVLWAGRNEAQPSWVYTLSTSERRRYAAYKDKRQSEAFLVGAHMVRILASMMLGMPEATLDVERTCLECGRDHDVPRIAGSSLAVSVSHSAEAIVVVMSRVGNIGVDVEQIPSLPVARTVASRCLAPDEAVSSEAEFATIWTRKEAVVKCTHDGILRVPLNRVRVSGPNETPVLLSYPGRPELPAVLRFLPLRMVPSGYRGALAFIGAEPFELSEDTLANRR